MSGFKTSTPGEAFPGVSGNTSSQSEQAWPVAQKARKMRQTYLSSCWMASVSPKSGVAGH